MIIRAVLVDPGEASRVRLATSLDSLCDVTVAATADDAATALLQAERVMAQVVILTGSSATSLPVVCEALHALESAPKILFLDGDADEDMLLIAIEAGVDGYTVDTDGVVGVGEAVRSIVRGEAVIPPAMLGSLLRRLIQRRRDAASAADRLVELTRREREVLSLLVDGLDHQRIATALFISPETARTHVQRILRKLDVHSRGEAVALFSQAGLADRLERMVDRSTS